MKHFLRWVSPLILGVIEFYFLRLATDLRGELSGGLTSTTSYVPCY